MKNNLDRLISGINSALDYIARLNGQKINVKDQAVFTPGPMLHKDTKTMDRHTSAKIERENQDAMDFSRHMTREFHNRIKE